MTDTDRNRALDLAWEYAEHTDISIFLTGKAGTGKTTFLRQLRTRSAKTIAVVAPTGVAAINAGGVTIHSFFQLPLTPYVPGADIKENFTFSKDKLRIIRAIDLLVIDEISMVRADLLDAIDNALRKYRRNSLPFGGVQLLMIGDLRQLAPVVTPRDEALLRAHYPTPYFFGSRALERINYVTIELTRVYRQQNPEFVNLLNAVRDSRLTPAMASQLNSRLQPGFEPVDGSGYIRLTTHNATAHAYNRSRLDALTTPSRTYTAQVKGTFPDTSYPTDERLTLKVGAQVMFLKNDSSGEHRYYNGKIGRVTALDEDSVTVECREDGQPTEIIEVSAETWENARYSINERTNTVESEVLGVFSQIPLRLAWAITIHKSQGLTFDRVVIDAGASFAPGQVYVALSRCRTLDGIVLATPISTGILGSDPTVSRYINSHADNADRSEQMLHATKAHFFRHLLGELFHFGEIATIQSNLSHIISTTFRVAFPEANAEQLAVAEGLREKVISVADKWLQIIQSSQPEALAQEAFLQRVRRGAEYFLTNLEGVMADSVAHAAAVGSENKKATQRVKELVADLAQVVHVKANLLKYVAEHGFTTESYLRCKQQAIIKGTRTAADLVSRASRAVRRAKKSASKSTSPKSKSTKPSSRRTPPPVTPDINLSDLPY